MHGAPLAGKAVGLLEQCTQRNAKGRTDSNTDGDPSCDVVECNAKSNTDRRADGNAHAGDRLTFLAISQVGSPIQSSTHHNTADR